MALNTSQQETVKVVTRLAKEQIDEPGSISDLRRARWRRWVDGYAAAVMDLAGMAAANEVREAFAEVLGD